MILTCTSAVALAFVFYTFSWHPTYCLYCSEKALDDSLGCLLFFTCDFCLLMAVGWKLVGTRYCTFLVSHSYVPVRMIFRD